MKNELEGARREAGRFGCGRVRDGEAVRTRGRGHGEEEKDLRGGWGITRCCSEIRCGGAGKAALA